jgi:hypothetical protein
LAVRHPCCGGVLAAGSDPSTARFLARTGEHAGPCGINLISALGPPTSTPHKNQWIVPRALISALNAGREPSPVDVRECPGIKVHRVNMRYRVELTTMAGAASQPQWRPACRPEGQVGQICLRTMMASPATSSFVASPSADRRCIEPNGASLKATRKSVGMGAPRRCASMCRGSRSEASGDARFCDRQRHE